jgi:membrane-associated phospholipid phosphatase
MEIDLTLAVHWAQWAGAHALPLFLALLLSSLVLTFVVVRVFEGNADRTDPTQASSTRQVRRRITLEFGLGFALRLGVMLAGIAVIAALSRHLGAASGMSQADDAFTAALRLSTPQSALKVFAVMTHLGDTATLTALCICVAVALVVMRHRGLAFGWLFAVAGNGVLNSTLKQIIGRDRPLFPEGGSLATGFSFPSGHTSGSVVAYGMLAYLALRLLPDRWQLLVVMTSVAVAITVGASRLFLRVHFASDVIAGFASGAAWLAACVTVMEVVRWKTSAPQRS